jgi:hypothetical protein
MNCIFPADSKNIIIFEKEAILKKEGEGVWDNFFLFAFFEALPIVVQWWNIA